MIDVDIAVIGSGSGNSLLTDDLSDRTFAMIEGGAVFGGTCLNVGCIPTKMYVHVAEIATAVREGGRLGVDATLERVRFTDVRDRVFGRIDTISAAGEAYRRDGDGVHLLRGRARFTGPRELEVEMRDGTTPFDVRYCDTASARRAPRAKLYSRVPRSSALPSMRIFTAG